MKKIKKEVYLVSVFGIILSGVLTFHPRPYITESRLLLGTAVQITCQYPEAIEKAFSEMERVDNLLSKFKKNSQIALLNNNKYRVVDDETLYVIEKAKKFYSLSDGAFDITVGPLVDIWKDAIKQQKLPLDEDIQKALKRVSSERIQIDKGYSIVSIAIDTELDLGGIGTGYAVDSAVEKLKKLGVRSALVNAGGDIYCLGTKGGVPWIVGIEDPINKTKFYKILKLKDQAVTTSGNYEQYFVHEGKRYTHIINPKTGYPVDNEVASATVIARDCLTADALATTVFVMGKTKGEEFIKNNFKNVKVEIITQK